MCLHTLLDSFFLPFCLRPSKKCGVLLNPYFVFVFCFLRSQLEFFFVSPLSTMNLWFHERRVDERSIVKICSGSSLNFRRLTVESFSSQFISEVKQNNENVKVKKT